MYERRNQPLASRRTFVQRLARNGLVALGIVVVSLMIGILGYHFLEGLDWIDALLNAAMLLGGMGPVDQNLKSDVSKIFASFYALYAGFIVLFVAGVLFAPLLHRFLHAFHLELEEDEERQEEGGDNDDVKATKSKPNTRVHSRPGKSDSKRK